MEAFNYQYAGADTNGCRTCGTTARSTSGEGASVDIVETQYNAAADAVTATISLVNNSNATFEFEIQANVVNGIEITRDLSAAVGPGGEEEVIFTFDVSGSTGDDVLLTVNVLEPFVGATQEEVDITEDTTDPIEPPVQPPRDPNGGIEISREVALAGAALGAGAFVALSRRG